MKFILNTQTDPAYNLAMEQMAFERVEDDVFLLWRNSPAVIVGKNQNTFAEIAMDYVTNEHIRVIRRNSGGGAVYHDLGNVNYTFILNDINVDSFHYAAAHITDFLQTLDIHAELQGRNDICIDGHKISGLAFYADKKRILFHGTLLYAADMEPLKKALQPKMNIESKNVKSNPSKVTNIANHMTAPFPVEEFMARLQVYLQTAFEAKEYILNTEDKLRLQQLHDTQYNTYEWNFSHPIPFSFENTQRFQGGTVSVNCLVQDGVLQRCAFSGDFFGLLPVCDIEAALAGIPYEKEAIVRALSSFSIYDYFYMISLQDLMLLLYP